MTVDRDLLPESETRSRRDGARATRGTPQERMTVASSFFLNGRTPPFVLFDLHGGLLDPAAATHVRISPGDRDALREFLLVTGDEWMGDPAVSAQERQWALHFVLPGIVEHLLFDQHLGKGIVEQMQYVAGLLATHALAGPIQRLEMCALIEVTDLRVGRALDCALLVTALAAERGEDDPRILAGLATAGLLADISIARMPRMVGADPDSPDPEVFRRHPTVSQELVRRLGIGSPIVHYAIAAHHERWDGRGYPKQIAGDRIPIEGRLLAVVDGLSQAARARGDVGLPSRETLAEVTRQQDRFDVSLLRVLVPMLVAATARRTEAEKHYEPQQLDEAATPPAA